MRSTARSLRVWAHPVVLVVLASCAPEARDEGEIGRIVSMLTREERLARATLIRDSAAAVGMSNGVLLGGIAQAETGLAHCWSEAMWACMGPASSSCGGGPVIAGAGDGACSLRQGGLGMFQFDAGDYDDTLAREGDRVLTVEGNTQAAVDFVVAMVIRSEFIAGVDTREQALAWMNAVRIGDGNYPTWIRTVTSYYNGCFEGRCSVYASRYAHYDEAARAMLDEMGEAFWYDDVVVPTCDPLPAEGGIIEESSPCFTGGGNPTYLRHASAGHAGALIWTHATDSATASNFARWRVPVAASGEYVLEVFTEADYAESRMTGYTIRHAGGSTDVRIDQTAVDGFQSLGTFRLEAGGDHDVYSGDNTGEPGSTNTQIVYDALRVSPASSPPPPPTPPTPPTPPPPGSDGGPPPARDAGVVVEPDGGAPRPDASGPGGGGVTPLREDEGCSATGPGTRPGGRFVLLLVLLAAAALSRARRGRRLDA